MNTKDNSCPDPLFWALIVHGAERQWPGGPVVIHALEYFEGFDADCELYHKLVVQFGWRSARGSYLQNQIDSSQPGFDSELVITLLELPEIDADRVVRLFDVVKEIPGAYIDALAIFKWNPITELIRQGCITQSST